MRTLPAEARNPRPTRAERKALPVAAMVYWDADGWAAWLIDGARLAHSSDRGERGAAFAPLTRDPDLDGPRELASALKSALPVDAVIRMEEGLAHCLAAWSWEDGAATVAFLVELAGYAEAAAPRTAIEEMLAKPHYFAGLTDAADLAEAIAFVLCERFDSARIRRALPRIEPLLARSPDAAVVVAARLASRDPGSFAARLADLAPNLFDLPPEDGLWRFAVNKLIEQAEVEGAVTAAFADEGPNVGRLRRALQIHRLELPPGRPGGVREYAVTDTVLKKIYRLDKFDSRCTDPEPLHDERKKLTDADSFMRQVTNLAHIFGEEQVGEIAGPVAETDFARDETPSEYRGLLQ